MSRTNCQAAETRSRYANATDHPGLIAGHLRLQLTVASTEDRGDAINRLSIVMKRSAYLPTRARQTPPEEAESAGHSAPSTLPYDVWY